MKYFYIYKITNIINNKIYIGAHETSNLDDGYMGSGKHLKNAINKYGVENFKKEILKFHDTKEDMYAHEKELVNEEFILKDNTYNLILGGNGGFTYINDNQLNLYGLNGFLLEHQNNLKIGRNTRSFRLMTDSEYYINECEKLSDSLMKHYDTHVGTFYGKKHSAETKEKIRKNHSKNKYQEGEKNSQYGTKWVYNESLKISKKIDSGEIIEDGWKEGRVINWNEREKKIVKKQKTKTINIEKVNKNIELYTYYYEIYKDVGWDKFVDKTGYDKSKPNLVSQFKRYVKNFTPQNGKKRGKL